MIFEEQVSRKPDYYNFCEDYIRALWSGFWTDAEFSFASDKQDFHTKLNEQEKEIIVRALSAIGQIEIAVKTFWIKLGDNLPHPSIRDMGIVMGNSECYSDDTEILTPNGWVLLKDVNIGDCVYQYTKDFTLEPTTVTNTIKKHYTGSMLEFGKIGGSNNCLVTPNHDMVIQREKAYGWQIDKVKAKDIRFHSSIKMPKTVLYKDGSIKSLSYLDRLFIAVQADGTRCYSVGKNGQKYERGVKGGYTHQIRIKKERKKRRLDNILSNLDIKYTVGNIKNNPDELVYYLYLADYSGKDLKSFDWVNLSDKSSNWCREFIEELVHWDGNKKMNTYFSKHKCNVDFCQHVAILGGLNSTVGHTEDHREMGQTKYRAIFSKKDKLWRRVIGYSKREVQYSGDVCCVSVPSGMIMTRRHGKTFIAGNCIHNMAYERLLEELGLTKIFEDNLKLDWIQGRVNYLKKYTKKFHSDNKKQFIYSLILFTLFVENISLFSQFYVINWFGRKNLLKDTNQQTSYTIKEELLHAQIGIKLINTIKEEHPELFDADLEERVYHESEEAFKAESKIVDWMVNGIDENTLSADILKEFIKNRINESLNGIGYNNVFEVNKDILAKTKWFEEEVLGNGMSDFFFQRPVEYSKHNQPFDEDALFQ